MRDELAFDLIQAASEIGKVTGFNIKRRALVADEEFKVAAFVAVVCDRPIALQKRLEIRKTFVQASLGQRGCEIAHQSGTRTALGNDAFRWVVRRV